MKQAGRRITTTAAMLLAFTACGGDDDEPSVSIQSEEEDGPADDEPTATTAAQATTTTTTEGVDSAEQAAAEYIERMNGLDPAVAQTAVDLAEPGSPAAAYAEFQAAQRRAVVSSGTSSSGISARTDVQDDGTIEGCQSEFGTETCTTFGGFVAAPSGKLVSFTVEGNDISSRVVGTTGEAVTSSQGATFTLRGALQFNNVVGMGVAFDVRAGESALAPPGPSGATYVSPDGQQFTGAFESSVYPINDIQPGATTTIVIGFGGGTVGGRLTLDLCSADFSDCSPVSMDVA